MDFESGGDQLQKDVIAKHLGGRLGQPTTYGNGTRIPDQDLCSNDVFPDMHSYFSAINLYGVILFACGGIAVVIMLLLYLDTLRYVVKNASSGVKAHTAFVVSVYPVVGIATYCAVVVPRAQLLAEAVAQGMFMFAMYQLFCLMVAYCGGEAELIRHVKPNSLNPRVAPCCCWPCCCILPLLAVNKRNVLLLRMLVLQLPVVQGLVYMILLVMWAEEESLYQVNYMYAQPFVVVSIILGVWGMAMSIKMLREVLGSHSLQSKFLTLQLVLLFSKLQGLAARISVWAGALPCNPPITPSVYGNIIYNIAMLIEMILLGCWARYLYKQPLPEAFPKVQKVEQVCALSTLCNTVEKPTIMDTVTVRASPKLNNNAIGCDNKNFIDVKL
ncbi:organic solute transporter alpha-like protein [Arctopsyche grandis]|uniref:organic solute transporter alpha-like protein n=1 Tax=Arctopsyche grandis TaxID=121162 RepID=UPI00406D8348